MWVLAVILPCVCLGMGLAVSKFFFYKTDGLVQLWMGAVFGLFGFIWLPALWAFLMDFTVAAQIAAAITAEIIWFSLDFITRKQHRHWGKIEHWKGAAVCCVPLWLFCFYLLHTHTLQQDAEGSLHTGQSTFGDMAMHLGFITSISEQKVFPPAYSLLPQVDVGYPFLCDSVSSSLYTLGLPLRWAYIIPALWALAIVFLGAYLLFYSWLKQTAKAVTAFILFFVGGGFGFCYFINGDWKNFTRIFTAFYETPTNYVEENVYWVNPVADLLIPQRATLMGWAILFACLYLLYEAAIEKKKEYFLPLGILAGGLPLIHTHSFLALGILSAVLLIADIFKKPTPSTLIPWIRYGGITLLLASGQLFGFTFRQAQGEQFVRFAWNWVNQKDNYFWFYIKNIGVVYLLLIPAWIHADKKSRLFYGSSLAILAISEILIFQPNPYDNNKLLFVWHLLGCGLVANLLWDLYQKYSAKKWAKVAFGAVMFLGTFGGVLTLGREAVSDYQLFTAKDVQAAEYIKQNTAPSTIVLTANNHNNLVAALTGRNILCGSPSYLYYHGVDYSQQSQAAKEMYETPSFAALQQWGIDYVLISRHEMSQFLVNQQWYEKNLNKVFSQGDITLYQVAKGE